VRASDFRASLERAIRIGAGDAYRGIVGGKECRPRHCDLSRGIEVDDRAGTVTIRLTAADPDFLHLLALQPASIVPATTPRRLARARPIPSTGPYRVASIDPSREVRLVRNRRFRVWAPDARPDGYPDEIRFVLRADPNAGLAAVEKDTADWVDVSGVPSRQERALLTRYAGRLHGSPASGTFWWFVNTRVPPFDDIRVRRAVNYAIDRGKLASLSDEDGTPSCQVLPPIFPGYRPYCPYTVAPNPAGTWTAPDLARAKALVRASGTAGMRVEVESRFDESGRLSKQLVAVLRTLGYRASLRRFHTYRAYYAYVGDSRNRAQIGWAGWIPDVLAPSNFLSLFECDTFVPKSPANSNLFEYCDPALDAKMRRAAALERADPVRADAIWADVDRALVDRAVLVPWVNWRQRVLVSERVGNHEGHPLWGTLLDQLWVR